MDVTILQPGLIIGRKKILEGGCHVRTIAKDTEDAKRNEGTRSGRCGEANTDSEIGSSHFETNEN